MTSFVFPQPIYITWEIVPGKAGYEYPKLKILEERKIHLDAVLQTDVLEILGSVSDSESIHMPEE